MLIVKLFNEGINGVRKAALLFLDEQRTDAGLAVYKVEEDAVANHQDNNCTVNSSSWGIKGSVAVFITHLKSKTGGEKICTCKWLLKKKKLKKSWEGTARES